jgi:hypothetical protein
VGSAAAAFAWEFRQRLRWGLLGLGGYLVVLAAVQLLAPRPPVRADRELLLAFTVLVPLCAAFMYCLAVFTHGLAGDLTARQSMYPARMFTLPVSTAALAGYPMLYGSLTVAGLYVVADLVAFPPRRVDLPWPAAAVPEWCSSPGCRCSLGCPTGCPGSARSSPCCRWSFLTP